MEKNIDYTAYTQGSDELVQKLVEDHLGWSSSIARSVARAWNLDWQLDGLDGGAYEGLLFCARRYDPHLGVPFRAYARKRIHESSTDEARKSKNWQRGIGLKGQTETAREISARLFEVYPELREGALPSGEDGEGSIRNSARQLLVSASVIAAVQELEGRSIEESLDYKKIVGLISELEPIHQAIIWALYWEGLSMRKLAEQWEIDELNVIREHKEILQFIFDRLSNPKVAIKKLKVRPGLRNTALEMRKDQELPPFSKFMTSQAALGLFLFLLSMRDSML